MKSTPKRWDIFCKVVDNFGDAGVSWRLARQLAAEHGCSVTLWLDDAAALARIAPNVKVDSDVQVANGVTIRRWNDPFDPTETADVVIEAFGCGLPDSYLARLAQQASAAHYFVLEYLSAEPWIEDLHGLPSPHPTLSIKRRFWFPGFTAKSGGLLRERGLFAARDAFQSDPIAQAAWWSAIGIAKPEPQTTTVSLFCYPNAALLNLLEAWEHAGAPVACIVPRGVARSGLDEWISRKVVKTAGAPLKRGMLRLHEIPFVPQDDYDKLLWACDINFVRGEDSFVRAQWAARPFVWHLYPQRSDAHLAKLDAFMQRYTEGLDPRSAAAARRIAILWNTVVNDDEMTSAWPEFARAAPRLGTHGRQWADHLAGLTELATGLVSAVKEAV